MLLNIPHEYEVLLAFFRREAAYVKTSYASISIVEGTTNSQHAEGFVEEQLFHPAGPGSTEEILCRMSITEANSLIEAAMQEALALASDDRYFTTGSGSATRPKYIFELNRKELEEELLKFGVNVNAVRCGEKAKQIKEICEGYKHRQRLRPTPKWIKASGTIENQKSVVPGAIDASFSSYELDLSHVLDYLLATKEFLDALQAAARARAP